MAGIYRIKQRVEATVENVFSFGVFARLDDGAQAYIRRRELDLDADSDPFGVVQVGERITGVIVALSEHGGHVEISRRAALPDPWAAFAQAYQVGDVVIGEVRRLGPRGVFVRVAAGVQGYLPLEGMAPWTVEKPADLFWVGDRVEAAVQEINLPQRRLELSVRTRLAERERALDLYEGLFSTAANGESQRHSGGEGLVKLFAAPPDLHLAGKLLIVEDNEPLRRSLTVWFRRRGLEAAAAGSLALARERCAEVDFDFVLLDLSLPDGDGLSLARDLTGRSPHPQVFVMSSSDNLIDRLDDLLSCEIAQIFPKPLDMGEIQACLAQIARGEHVQVFKPAGVGRLAAAASEAARADQVDDSQGSVQLRLERALLQVHKSVKAQQTILFRLDLVAHVYTIQAMTGLAGQASEPGLASEQMYKLGDSPVKDALYSGSLVVEGRAQSEGKARYQKLLDLLPFESCLGLPLSIQGEYTHALFFFHPLPDAFSHYRQRDARSGAYLIAALLEEAAADQRIQALSPLLISGQLASGFGHEIANQISSLELEIINHLAAPGEPDEAARSLAGLMDRVQELKETTLGFQRTLWARDEHTDCDLQAVLEQAYQVVRPYARKNKTRITLSFGASLPRAGAHPVGLQQVFVNVLLNAIQQIGLKSEQHAWEGIRRIEVRTCVGESPGKIAVRIQDTGPGIHRRLWKKIFTAGFSTRGGSGIGLYISQSILRQAGGSIEVEESLIPYGTTFLIQLPVHPYGDML